MPYYYSLDIETAGMPKGDIIKVAVCETALVDTTGAQIAYWKGLSSGATDQLTLDFHRENDYAISPHVDDHGLAMFIQTLQSVMSNTNTAFVMAYGANFDFSILTAHGLDLFTDSRYRRVLDLRSIETLAVHRNIPKYHRIRAHTALEDALENIEVYRYYETKLNG